MIGPIAPLAEVSRAQWRRHLTLNLEAPLFLTQGLITQLKGRGFALLELDISARAEAIQRGLSEASALGGFRFPPINVDEVRYQDVHRAVFSSLYETAIDSLSPFASEALDELAELDRLFSASPHEPFPREHLFHPTFFNLFNYDHGSLNSHQDRGLLTVIHVEPPQLSARPHSALWVEGPDQRWRDADRALLDAAAQSPESTFTVLLLG